MEPFSPGAVGAAYDAASDDYVVAFGDDLDRLPLDREVLDRVLDGVPAAGFVLEAGCGPAPAAHYLGDRAPRVVGADLSEQMLRAACSRTPRVLPTLSDLRALPLRDGCCALAIAYYCLQHFPRPELPAVLAGLRRVLAPGGVLAVAAHLGDGGVLVDEFLGHRILPVGGTYYSATNWSTRSHGRASRSNTTRERAHCPTNTTPDVSTCSPVSARTRSR